MATEPKMTELPGLTRPIHFLGANGANRFLPCDRSRRLPDKSLRFEAIDESKVTCPGCRSWLATRKRA